MRKRAFYDGTAAADAPQEITGVLRWTGPAITPASRAQLFAGMRGTLPPEAFDGLLGFVKSHLERRDADKLERAPREMIVA